MLRCIAGSVEFENAEEKMQKAMEGIEDKDYNSLGNDKFPNLYKRLLHERKLKSAYWEWTFYRESKETYPSKISFHQSLVNRKFIKKRYRRAREPSRISLRFVRCLKSKSRTLKKFLFKRISSILILKTTSLTVKKVGKLYNARYKCNHKHDRK